MGSPKDSSAIRKIRDQEEVDKRRALEHRVLHIEAAGASQTNRGHIQGGFPSKYQPSSNRSLFQDHPIRAPPFSSGFTSTTAPNHMHTEDTGGECSYSWQPYNAGYGAAM